MIAVLSFVGTFVPSRLNCIGTVLLAGGKSGTRIAAASVKIGNFLRSQQKVSQRRTARRTTVLDKLRLANDCAH